MKSKLFYKNKSLRLQHWDYRTEAAYFITICLKNMQHQFGKVSKGNVHLSDIGKIAESHWLTLPDYHERVALGSYVIMPNHIHGIILLNGDIEYDSRPHLSTFDLEQHELSSAKRMSAISPRRGSISSIIGSYKSGVSKHARKILPSFAWQPRFYEHIIRNNSDYISTSEYIRNNPERWASKHL